MTRVRIAPPDIEEDVSAEQVAAYLLRPGSGWVEWSTVNTTRAFRMEVTATTVIVSVEPDAVCIKRIARAEQRHPSAVLADIVGPARAASVGRACEEKLTGAPWVAQTKCLMAGWPEEKRKSAMRNFLAFVSKLDDEDDDSAARGAGEESE